MFCSKCGKELRDEAIICPYCAEPVSLKSQNEQLMDIVRPSGSAKEIQTAKILGIIAVIGAIISPLIGWICGGIGLSKSSNLSIRYGEAKDLQTAKIMSIVGLAVATINFFVAIVILALN